MNHIQIIAPDTLDPFQHLLTDQTGSHRMPSMLYTMVHNGVNMSHTFIKDVLQTVFPLHLNRKCANLDIYWNHTEN